MKLPGGRIEAFLRRPDPAVRAVLLYGPDAGLVRERADTLGRAVSPDLHDPFRVADLGGTVLSTDPARLYDEAAQVSLMGGPRLVRVREVGDAQGAVFARFLADPPSDGLVVVEAGDLPARGALRRIFDDAPCGVAIGCYPDSARDLAEVIRSTFARYRIAASRDAMDFLVMHLGGDRLQTRAELEKLALYVGDGGNIELDDAQRVIADSATLSIEDAIRAAAEGDVLAVDRALARVFQEGESPVSVIRAALRHGQRLHALNARRAVGRSVDDVLREARPPIFFKQQASYRQQLARWREPQLRRLLDCLATAEAQVKTTGMPGETLCREVLFTMAQLPELSSRAATPAIGRADRG